MKSKGSLEQMQGGLMAGISR